jgi:hypothetical protein
MSWLRTLLSIVALGTLAMIAHPSSVLALIEVRSGPGMTYEVVVQVPPGGSYVVVAQEQDWYKIQLPDGRKGWIHRFYAGPEQSPSQSTPVVATPPATPAPTAPLAASTMPATAPPPAVPSSRPVETGTAPLRAHRIALVIGNAAYAESPLQNAGKDAMDIAAMLRRLGFEVTLLRDVSLQEMEEAVHAFNLRLRQGGMGLFYFAGHGVQMNGENYLIPLKARIDRQRELHNQALPMGRIIRAMEEATNELNILILDACRDLPFSRSWRSGLALPPAARGMLIAYATAPGGVAADGARGENGVYTKHLLQAMMIPGLSIEQLFKHVRNGVVAETRGKQIPWESSSLQGDFAFVPAQAVSVPSAPLPGPVTPSGAAEFPPSPALSAPPQQPTERVGPSSVASANPSHQEAGHNNLMDRPSPPPTSEGYTLIRRVYCEDRASGVIRGRKDLIFTSYLSCEEAKNALLVWEQQKGNCNFLENARESTQKANEWIDTPKCKMSSYEVSPIVKATKSDN